MRRYFTFGRNHMSNYPLPPRGGVLADYWVTVDTTAKGALSHRGLFIEHFTNRYCPAPNQFAFEYGDDNFKPAYFPGGELCVITDDGIAKLGGG